MTRQGFVHATTAEITDVFGPAGPPWDPNKTHVEWTLDTPHGPATIYDYGDCHDCAPDCNRRPRPGQLVEWHIGGHNHATAEWVRAAVAAAYDGDPAA